MTQAEAQAVAESYLINDRGLDLADWELVSSEYNSISSGRRSAPAFADLDQDGDLDLLVGNDEGGLSFYENDGSPHLPSWTPVTDNYLFLDLGAYSAPALVDIDADGDTDGDVYGPPSDIGM